MEFSIAELVTGPGLLSLATLTLLEIVLGIDNIVFISIIAGKLPADQQGKARFWGIALALFARVALLFGITWIMQLSQPLFTIFGEDISLRDLILIGGGGFLLYKATTEIHEKLEGEDHENENKKKITFARALVMIVLLDIVFSIDSILTAIGIGENLAVMVIAVVISLAVMLIFARAISDFVNKHPTVKMLALSFLMMIGVVLIADGLHFHIPKGYIYSAMAFSLVVEMLNLQLRGGKKSNAVELKKNRLQRTQDTIN